MQKNNNTIFLVTGGTGGHFFPALAVAQKDKEHKHIFIVDNRVKRNFENENPVEISKTILSIFFEGT